MTPRLHAAALILILSALACSTANDGPSRPNILLIVADDLGYSDLGAYGGEIETPHIDRIAAEGIRFSNFQVNPMCILTRTSLLTGHMKRRPRESHDSIVIAELLRDAGYATSISGKWHQPGHPMNVGFERFFGFLGGSIDSFNGGGQLLAGTQQVANLKADFYATDAFTDHTIASIEMAVAAEKPFFSFLSLNAPHTPIQAPRADVEKYVGRYREGWETLRRARYQRQRRLGLIDARYVMIPPDAEVRRWDELSDDTKVHEDFRMAAYAGMVDRVDQNLGRLMEFLRARQLLENTVVIFLSDNGADYGGGSIETWKLQDPSRAGSHMESSNGWSYLKNTPFRLYKHSTNQGGVSAPLIVRWPVGIRLPAGQILHQRVHVTDIYPTLLELARVEMPQSRLDRTIAPLFGSSIVPLLRDAALGPFAVHDAIYWEHRARKASNSKAMTQGDWKIVSTSSGPWQLYNVAEDPAESTNLAGLHPERIIAMVDDASAYAAAHTRDAAYWKQPLSPKQQGWGIYRLNEFMKITDCNPPVSSTDVSRETELSFSFDGDVDFLDTHGKTLRLYAVGDPEAAVWQSDPEPGYPISGQRTVVFRDLPRLQSDRSYYLVSDPGWIRVAGQPLPGFNDGSIAYRFRTAP